MARQRRAATSATLNIRVDEELKARLLAAAYWELLKNQEAAPADVNLSEFLREVLELWLNAYETTQPGGARAIFERYQRDELASLEETVRRMHTRRDGLNQGR